MKRLMFFITLISFTGLVVSVVIYSIFSSDIALFLGITFGTILYHFAMCLAVGYAVNGLLNNKADYRIKWFKTNNWEIKLYKKLRVKSWKKYIPTFVPETFGLDKNTVEKIVQVTCQAEIVHEIIMVLSFVPLLFSIWFDEFTVFFITSLLSCLFDLIFVILQRFNRPRLLKLINKSSLI